MSKLESLVPPLELCKKIPEGEFGDSCFVRIGEDTIILRSNVRVVSGRQDDIYPAPTLEEIMAAMPYCQIYKRKSGSFVGCYDTRWDQKVSGETGSMAALKMWLKLKGINHE